MNEVRTFNLPIHARCTLGEVLSSKANFNGELFLATRVKLVDESDSSDETQNNK